MLAGFIGDDVPEDGAEDDADGGCEAASPPAVTFTVVKQSVAMSMGSLKLIWNRPGYPKEVPA